MRGRVNRSRRKRGKKFEIKETVEVEEDGKEN